MDWLSLPGFSFTGTEGLGAGPRTSVPTQVTDVIDKDDSPLARLT